MFVKTSKLCALQRTRWWSTKEKTNKGHGARNTITQIKRGENKEKSIEKNVEIIASVSDVQGKDVTIQNWWKKTWKKNCQTKGTGLPGAHQ
jgi:hypothetical protein